MGDLFSALWDQTRNAHRFSRYQTQQGFSLRFQIFLKPLKIPKATQETCSLVKRETTCLNQEVFGSNVLGSKACCKQVLSDAKKLVDACNGSPSAGDNGTSPTTDPSGDDGTSTTSSDDGTTDPSTDDA